MGEDVEVPASSMKRFCWIPAPASFNLNMACVAVNKAFSGEGYGCYLVGSALHKRDYRDVDVRFIMKDASWARLFGADRASCPHLHPLWSLLCTSIACWLQKQTGLPVDFQIQQCGAASAEFPDLPRYPLGVFTDPVPRDYAADVELEK